MTSDEIRRKHREYLMPSVINYYQEPIAIDSAKGVYITDVDGREYLDFFGGILTVSLSHANEDVNAAVKFQLDRLSHISSLYPTAPMVQVAEALAGIMPGDVKQSFFVASGTEADEMAVMLAMSHTGALETAKAK